MANVNDKQLVALQQYAAIMEEIKIRLSSMDVAFAGGFRIQGQLVREYCFLQLRLTCELIALACLTAHGDIEATAKLRKHWDAAKIIKELEALHPGFYPWPVQQKKVGDNSHVLEGINEGYLTKSELLDLYGKSGDVLHRAT